MPVTCNFDKYSPNGSGYRTHWVRVSINPGNKSNSTPGTQCAWTWVGVHGATGARGVLAMGQGVAAGVLAMGLPGCLGTYG